MVTKKVLTWRKDVSGLREKPRVLINFWKFCHSLSSTLISTFFRHQNLICQINVIFQISKGHPDISQTKLDRDATKSSRDKKQWRKNHKNSKFIKMSSSVQKTKMSVSRKATWNHAVPFQIWKLQKQLIYNKNNNNSTIVTTTQKQHGKCV